MKMIKIEVGRLQSNAYLLQNEETDAAILVDCGGSGKELMDAAIQAGLAVKGIFLTHGHADHIEGVDHVAAHFSCPVFLHREDLPALIRPDYNLSFSVLKRPLVLETKGTALEDGQVVECAGFAVRCIHTPGHTPGSACYLIGRDLFTGDTLFLNSVGGEFPPFGNLETELDSIRQKLFSLPLDYCCYPGHGAPTSLFYEKEQNLYCGIQHGN